MARVLRRECVLLLAGMLAVCNGDDGRVAFQAEPLGAVGIGAGEAVQTQSALSYNGAPLFDSPIRYGIELALGDAGSAAALQIVGVIRTSCSGAAVTASLPLSGAGLGAFPPSSTWPQLTYDFAGKLTLGYHPGYFRTSNNELNGAAVVAQSAYRRLGLRRWVDKFGYNLGGEITVWGVDGGGWHERHGERVQAELRQHVEVIIEFFERV